jgi:hypothetical protein
MGGRGRPEKAGPIPSGLAEDVGGASGELPVGLPPWWGSGGRPFFSMEK